MDRDNAVSAALQRQHDAGLMQVLGQFVTSLNRMSSEVMRLAFEEESFPSVGYVCYVCCLVVGNFFGRQGRLLYYCLLCYVNYMFVSGGVDLLTSRGRWCLLLVLSVFGSASLKGGFFTYLASQVVGRSGAGRSGVRLSSRLCLCAPSLVALEC